MALLEVRGLSRHYDGLKALDDLSFDVEAGRIVSLIGPNGAGKTTTFDCSDCHDDKGHPGCAGHAEGADNSLCPSRNGLPA